MIQDGLKLTTYGGERQRTDGRFVGDALLDLYARHQIRTSLLLRGAQGFGPKHGLRTDRLLTLSEDLPLVSVAVDERARIEALLADVTATEHHGLVTLERARLLTGDIAGEPLPDAAKLTVYVGRRERIGGAPAHLAICDLLHRRGVAGATVLLGVDGTAHGERRRAAFLGRNAGVPLMVIAVGSAETLTPVLPELGRMLERPLMTVERVTLWRRDGQRLEEPREPAAIDAHGLAIWQKIMVYGSEQAIVDGRPQHQLLVERLRREDAAGATALRGIWGFHGDHPPHGDRLWQLRRHVPAVTVIVDTPERMQRVLPVIEEVTRDRGLVTSELVPAVAADVDGRRRGGLRLARP
ncbi:MAG TPA: DUF190 domain-containing protein [Baekduia sp.]|nr:DUF190 domain-containing protein [Baekduia sp.]